jgi:UDP-N-acetylglucosamine/UDP-N-acetylgalactosamine diphosphorylase
LDPLFIGYTCENGYQASTKTVERESETEPVGLVVSKNGITQVIEYTEVPENIRNEREAVERTSYWYAPPPGKLIFHQAQILVFLLDAQFLLQMVTQNTNSVVSMYHKATKKIEHFDFASQ